MPCRDNADCISYERDIAPILAGTDFYLKQIRTDWPPVTSYEFEKR